MVRANMHVSRVGGEREGAVLDCLAFRVPPAYLQPIWSLLAVHCRNYRGVGQKTTGEGSLLAQKHAKSMQKNSTRRLLQDSMQFSIYKGGIDKKIATGHTTRKSTKNNKKLPICFSQPPRNQLLLPTASHSTATHHRANLPPRIKCTP
jgi:hypothetical protein